MSIPFDMTELAALRQQLRLARRSLSPRERIIAADAALGRIRRLPSFLRARRIALYAGADGELCPLPLADSALDLGKQVCLPVLHPFRPGRLLFCVWRPGDRLRHNRFGIAEPIPTDDNLVATRWLDLVITPLLGFDERGNRLGMGGGYYDRSFAFKHRHRSLRRPLMVGLAHELQKVACLEARSWDIRLDAVATNSAVYQFRH